MFSASNSPIRSAAACAWSRRNCASNSTPGISSGTSSSRWVMSRSRRPTSRSSAIPTKRVRSRAPQTCGARRPAPRSEDEAALVRRYPALGRAHARRARRGGRRACTPAAPRSSAGMAAPRSFTLSQAVVSRGASSFNAYGTMLLSQDVGQSLFVSAKLDGLGADLGVVGRPARHCAAGVPRQAADCRALARPRHLDAKLGCATVASSRAAGRPARASSSPVRMTRHAFRSLHRERQADARRATTCCSISPICS